MCPNPARCFARLSVLAFASIGCADPAEQAAVIQQQRLAGLTSKLNSLEMDLAGWKTTVHSMPDEQVKVLEKAKVAGTCLWSFGRAEEGAVGVGVLSGPKSGVMLCSPNSAFFNQLSPIRTVDVQFGDRTARFSACVILPLQNQAIHYWLWSYGHDGTWTPDCPIIPPNSPPLSAIVHRLSISVRPVPNEQEVDLDIETRGLVEHVLTRLTPVLFDR